MRRALLPLALLVCVSMAWRIDDSSTAVADGPLKPFTERPVHDAASPTWTFEEKARFEHMAFTPDGKLFLAVGGQKLWAWELDTARFIMRHFSTGRDDFPRRIHSLAVSPDSRLAAIGLPDGTIQVFQLGMKCEIIRLLHGTDWITGLCFTEDGKRLRSASEDGSIRLWHLATEEELERMEFDAPVYGPRFSADGTFAIFGSDFARPAVIVPPPEPTIPVLRAGMLAVADAVRAHLPKPPMPDPPGIGRGGNGEFASRGSGRGAGRNTDDRRALKSAIEHLVAWNVESGMGRRKLFEWRWPMIAHAVSPNGGRLAAGSIDNKLAVFDASTGRGMHYWNAGHARNDEKVTAITFLPDGRSLFVGTSSGAVRWSTISDSPSQSNFLRHNSAIESVAVSPDGLRAASSDENGGIRIWNLLPQSPPLEMHGHTGRILALALSPSDNRILSAGMDSAVRLWNAETGKELRSFKGHADRVNAVACFPDGKHIASADKDSAIRVWDVRWGDLKIKFDGHSAPVLSLASSEDGQFLLSAGGKWESVTPSGESDSVLQPRDCSVRMWSMPLREQVRRFEGHTGPVVSARFVGQDIHRIVSAGEDGTVRLWDVETGDELERHAKHQTEIKGMTTTADGRNVASVDAYGEVWIWDLDKGTASFGFGEPEDLWRKPKDRPRVRTIVQGLAFSPHGTRLAVILADTVTVFETRKGTVLVRLSGFETLIHAAVFSSDGNALYTGGSGNTIRKHRLPEK